MSDRCSCGQSVDESGPNLAREILEKKFGIVLEIKCIPDEQKIIELELVNGSSRADVILTTGGTGFSPRDVTPEATKAVIEREVPGFPMAMLLESLSKTPHAALSRPVCGIKGGCLIINLPGSVKGSSECFSAIAPTLKHAVDLLQGRNDHGSSLIRKSKVSTSNVANRPRESQWPMISVEDSQELVMQNKLKLTKENLPLSLDLFGRVIASDVSSVDPLPPFRASIKDGYAVLSSDGKGSRKVLKSLTAGMSADGDMILNNGECVRVNTGGPLPANADAVVQVEDTSLLEASSDGEEVKVLIAVAPKPGQDIRPVGNDIALNEVVLKTGDAITSIELGLLATIGVTSVPVFRLPKVSVLSTGNEVVEPGVELRPGAIRDSNRITLLSLLRNHRFPTYDLGIAKDEPDDILSHLIKGLETSDIILTTGGVSMGERDYLKAVITEDLGATIHFARVNMKPGKPTTFATCSWNGKLKMLFCLPGNPVSATVTFHLYVLPALRGISGHKKQFSTTITVRLGFDIKKLDPRPEYRRVVLDWNQSDGIPLAKSTGDQISSRLMSWREANCLLILPSNKEVEEIKNGTLLKGLIVGSL
ncbi:gephyrin isoform X2 [Halyomorpha halys]|uniref:gephyrin isoform X2 n=1 Tax=Halyomorpha halys TaxID=286706 RepID=UPI0034D2772E